MKQERMDSEVLRIIIEVLKAQTKDDEGDSRWQEDAQWYLIKLVKHLLMFLLGSMKMMVLKKNNLNMVQAVN